MKHRKKIIGVITAVMLLALAAIPVMAQPPVCYFSGTVTLDGASVAAGTTITAKADGTVVGTGEAYIEDSASKYSVLVPQVDGVPAEDAALNFYVDGNVATTSGDTATWEAGGLKTVNLAATSGVVEETIEEQLADIEDELQIVYYFDNVTKAWSYYWPGVGGTIDVLTAGKVYWINVSAACDITTPTLGEQHLTAGWNNIVW